LASGQPSSAPPPRRGPRSRTPLPHPHSESSTSSSFGGGGGGAGGCSTGSRGGVPTRTCILRLGGGVARVRCGEVGGVGVGVGISVSSISVSSVGVVSTATAGVEGVGGSSVKDGGRRGVVVRGDRGSLGRVGVRVGDGSVVTVAGLGGGMGDTLFGRVRVPANRSRRDRSDAAILDAADDRRAHLLQRIPPLRSIRLRGWAADRAGATDGRGSSWRGRSS
jgi:hypothetical protein